MIEIKGNEVVVDPHHPQFGLLHMLLTKEDKKKETIVKLYRLDENRNMRFDRGLLSVLPKLNIPQSELTGPNDISNLINDVEVVEDHILPGITLRPEQKLAVSRCLICRRGLIQAATGSGKTFMICAFIQELYNQLGYYPTTLVLVPTDYLMDQMIKVMNSVGIPATSYKSSRMKLSGVTVAHPKSINNDMLSGLDLSGVKVLIGDEAHHTQSITWSYLFRNCVGANYILGFSASIVKSKRLPITKITQLSIQEAITIGATGNILLDIPTSFYRDKEVLATPRIIQIQHQAREYVSDEKNWHQIRKNRLESEARTRKIAQVAKIFNDHGLKVLILISTHEHGYRLLSYLAELGLADKSMCSYGSYQFYQYVDGEIEKLPKDSMSKFESGEVSILIGSSHVYEGADISNLDTVIMGVVGKSSRRVIQAVGRSLRKTKNGRYAYIVDFTDQGGGVLSYHTYQREQVYREQVGVSKEDIIRNVPVDKLSTVLSNLESIEEA